MAKQKNIKREQVAFNLDDPFQRTLWQHLRQHTNISAQIKALVQRDMEGGNTGGQIAEVTKKPALKPSQQLVSGLI